MLQDLFFAFWFLLPAACANVAPILAAAIPGINKWNAPIDGGKAFGGKPVFGPHKTWLGLLSGIVVATAVLALQILASRHYGWSNSFGFDYGHVHIWILGPLFGLGALGGDAIESFFKRRAGIASGKTWVPFDQLDYIIGGIIVSLPFAIFPLMEYIWMLLIWFAGHLLASYIGYKTGFKESPI